MPQKSLEELALDIAIEHAQATTTLAPGPGPKPSSSKAALRRCCAAWQRAFDAYMEQTADRNDIDAVFAARPAAEAYRNAMPLLNGCDGVRDFVACTAHGILIDAIPREKGPQLLSAARVALAAFQAERKPRKAGSPLKKENTKVKTAPRSVSA